MTNRYLALGLSFALILLFFSMSALLIIMKHDASVPTIGIQPTASLSGNVVREEQTPVSSISNENTLLIKVDDNTIDQISAVLESKGATIHKHRIGNVISASIPQNQLDSLNQEVELLPNRQVKAFSIDEVSETNVENFWNQGMTGNNIVIAVLDTGINSDKVIDSVDFIGEGIQDDDGHGTKIAEIILAMAPDAKLMNVKVLDKNGLGSESSVIAGINYAVENHADVISLSLGGLFNDINSPLVSAVEDAVSKGVTVVVASGNCGQPGYCGDFVGVATPGNSPNAITVGSVSGESAVPYSSGQNLNGFIKPDVVAPENANSLSGTSASTPFVAGAAALVIEKYQANPLQVKSLIEQNAKDLGEEGKDIVFGSGKLNLNFLTEQSQEERINITPQPVEEPSEDKTITEFSTTKAGDWNKFAMIRIPDSDVMENGLFFHVSLKSDLYNENFGFQFLNNAVYKINLTAQREKLWFGEDEGVKDIIIINPSNAYLVGLEKIKRYDGTNLVEETLPPHQVDMWYDWVENGFDLTTIDFNGTTILAGGTNYSNNGIILKKQGASWTIEPYRFLPISDIKFVNSTVAFALGSNRSAHIQKIYKWTKGTWTEDFTDSVAIGKLNELEIVSGNLAFAVGEQGKIIKWDGTWNYVASPTTVSLNDVSFYSSTSGYAVGDNGIILRYDGTNWIKNSEGVDLLSYHNLHYTGPLCPRTTPLTAAELETVIGSSVPSVVTNINYSDVHILSPTKGILFGNGKTIATIFPRDEAGTYCQDSVENEIVEMRLEPSAPFFNMPELVLEQNSTRIVTLTDYSDGNSFAVNSGNCAMVSGTQMKINPAANFFGLMSCTITATKDGLNTVQDMIFDVKPISPVADLAISSSDIRIAKATGIEDINITIHNIGRTVANNIKIKLIETSNNKFVQETTGTISSILNKSHATKTVSMDITRGNVLTAVIDYDNSIAEESESNNRAEIVYHKNDVLLNITTQPDFRQPIADYLKTELKEYNVIDSGSAQVIINIGYAAGDNKKGCKNGVVHYAGNSVADAHAGLVFETGSVINVCAPRIEGLVNALQRMDKEDLNKNKEMFFDRSDLGALAVRDFFNGKTATASLVSQSLNGAVEASQDFIEANDGTLLRLKHYKPIVSQSFVDYLFNIKALDGSWLPPVVMARGLWSTVNDWDSLAKEISLGIGKSSVEYTPRDVWLIELTGGPGTDCSTCNDYTYDDVVDQYWPALVGGVIKLTGKSPVSYIGHSNGARTALDALRNITANPARYSPAGKLSNGVSFDMPSNPVDLYIGMGIPGNFSSPTLFTENVKDGNGDRVIQEFTDEGKTHITLSQVGARLKTMIGSAISIFTQNTNEKISTNLLKSYFNFASSTNDKQPGGIISGISKATIISGDLDFDFTKSSDVIVPVSDATAIFNNLKPQVTNITRVIVHSTHAGLPDDKQVKTVIKRRLSE